MSHSIHTGHPDTIFFDGCDECDRKAKDPVIYLDSERMARLWRKMIDVEVFNNGSYNSANEKIAAQSLWRTYLLLERHTNINPQTLLLY